MNNPENAQSLSQILSSLKSDLSDQKLTMGALFDVLGARGTAIILIFFAAPMALPLPVPPGINIMLASPLLLLTGHQALGIKKIWLPKKMKEKALDQKKMGKLLDGIVPFMKKLEIFIKPRLGFLCTELSARIFGMLGFLMALTVCIPVPLTNTVPSLGITLMSIGFSMRDGLAVILGALIGMAWIILLLSAVIIFGPEAFDIIKQTIKYLF